MNEPSQKIAASFKGLIFEKPYKSITVGDICERACTSRKSFYVNFHNKEDVVSSIFIEDAIRPVYEINSLFTTEQSFGMHKVIQQKLYDKIYENKEYYRALVGPMRGQDDTFLRVATHAIYELNIRLLSDSRFVRDLQKMDYIGYFFASSQSLLIQKWISDDFPYSPKELNDLYNTMTDSFWLTTFNDSKK